MKQVKIGLLTLSATLFLGFSKASAQGTYIRAFGGYSAGTNKSLLPGYLQSDVSQNEAGIIGEFPAQNLIQFGGLINLDQSYVRDSYGKGVHAGLAVGYMFNKHIGAELGVSYLFGDDIEYRSEYKDVKTIVDFSSKASMLQINPSIVLTTGSEVVSPYVRLGVLVGTSVKVKTKATSSTDNYTLEDELRKGIALGGSAALGINYNLSNKVSLFAEAEYRGMSYNPDEREVTRIVDQGKEVVVSTVYDFPVQSLQDNANNGIAFSNFKKSARMSTPFSVSSLGLNIGVMYKFGGAGNPRGR